MDDLAALRLQIEWGADEALEEAPINRTLAAAAPRAAPRALTPAPGVAADRIGAPRPRPAARARDVAMAANTLDELRQALAGFTDCPLAATATNLVFADGNPAAGIVLVGEAPGEEEDRQGRPFVGPSGKFLDRMIGSIGLDRERVLITNLIPWRPPGNRPPTEDELMMCLPFLQRHLVLARPRLVAALGSLSTRALTGSDAGVRRLRGKWRELKLEGMDAPAQLMPMYHPAYLLRTPGAKRDAWADWLAFRQAIGDP
jgi:DNA polymerase